MCAKNGNGKKGYVTYGTVSQLFSLSLFDYSFRCLALRAQTEFLQCLGVIDSD